MSLETQLSKAESDVQAGKNQFKLGVGAFLFFLVICGFGIGGATDSIGLFLFFDAVAFVTIFFWGDNGGAAQQEVDYLKGAIQNEKQRKRRQEKQRKNKETKKKQEQEKKKKELNLANELVEIGGIENLNKAIGIFEKYGK